jgi:hypothetical protein
MHRPAPRRPGLQVKAATAQMTAIRDGAQITDSDHAGALDLLAIDFQGVYQVNVAAASERLSMLRFSLSLLAAPFGATVALVSARVVAPSSLTAWPHVPRYLFGLLAAFGLLAVLPYLRLIEASITHARTARAMNNFRLLYTLQLRTQFAALGWSPNLPVDPHYPAVFAPLSWPGLTASVLALLEGAWIAVGLAGLARVPPAPALLAGAIATAAGVLLALYYLRAGTAHRRQPANPFGFPFVET